MESIKAKHSNQKTDDPRQGAEFVAGSGGGRNAGIAVDPRADIAHLKFAPDRSPGTIVTLAVNRRCIATAQRIGTPDDDERAAAVDGDRRVLLAVGGVRVDLKLGVGGADAQSPRR